jgi:hypothetical protein
VDKLFVLIKKLIDDKFYGSLEIKFEAGKIVLLKKVQTVKID